MTTKTLQAWTAGCGTSLLLRAALSLGVLAALAVCVGGASIVPLPRGVDRDLFVMAAFLLTMLGCVAAAVVFAVALVVRRARHLDAAFAPLGVAAQQYLTNGRQYHGIFGGRQLDAYFYRGPVFELYLGTPLQTRLGLAPQGGLGRAMANMVGRQPIALAQPVWEGVSAYALDEPWSRALLSDTRARASLLRLIDEDAPGAARFESRQVILQPEAWLLRLHHTRVENITPAHVRAWLDDLRALAEAAEALPAPQATAAPTALERNSRANRGAFLLPAVLIVMGFIAVLLVCSLAPLVYLFLTSP